MESEAKLRTSVNNCDYCDITGFFPTLRALIKKVSIKTANTLAINFIFGICFVII